MTKELTLAQARERLEELPELLADKSSGGALTITRDKKPVLLVLPWDAYESWRETIEILADEKLVAQIKQSVQEIEEGKTQSWETVKSELGISTKPKQIRRQRQRSALS